jgi:triphosphoribosyl-dephospho-CoA synthase
MTDASTDTPAPAAQQAPAAQAIGRSAAEPVARDPVRSRVEHAFLDACLLDVTALKPGNVGLHGSGHGMQAVQFLRSARAAAPVLAAEGHSVGERIHGAIAATHATVGTNTNLGIVLLAAPLAHAALRAPHPLTHRALLEALTQVLDELSVKDGDLAFAAIRLANPGGLGTAARHDVRQPAQVGLRQAMREAADRDSIARQYANSYADVVRIGLARWQAARSRGRDRRWSATEVFLAFAGELPDSHVARKLGLAQARVLSEAAKRYAVEMEQVRDCASLEPALREWDQALKARGVNPGTSADLTVATLFWSLLLEA